MGQRLPIDAEAVLCNALNETLEIGVLKHDEGVLTENEKDENIQWFACHLLATRLHESVSAGGAAAEAYAPMHHGLRDKECPRCGGRGWIKAMPGR